MASPLMNYGNTCITPDELARMNAGWEDLVQRAKQADAMAAWADKEELPITVTSMGEITLDESAYDEL